MTPGGRGSHPTELGLQAIDDRAQTTQIDEIVLRLTVESGDRIFKGLQLERHADILQTFVRKHQRCTVNLREPGPPNHPPVAPFTGVPERTNVYPQPLSESVYTPGSKADFDLLYRTAYPRVFRTLSAILGDPQAAEDCTQDSFVQAFQAWSRWRPDAPAEAWVHRIAVNRAIGYRRSSRLRTAGEMIRRLGRPTSHTNDPADEATRPDLLTALRAIPPKLAAAIVLRHYHGYNNREIAAALGVSERTVGTRLRQAADQLRAQLEPHVSLEASEAFPEAPDESYAQP